MIAGLHMAFANMYAFGEQWKWETAPAKHFEVKDNQIFADGEPFYFGLVYPYYSYDAQFGRFWRGLGGTVKLQGASPLGSNFSSLDDHIRQFGQYGVYTMSHLSIADQFGGAYIKLHPEAMMMNPDGTKVSRNYASFWDEGYRRSLAEALKKLAAHLKDTPYFMGYFLNDEFSYPGGDYNPSAIRMFRKKMVEKYGSVENVNKAWETGYKTIEEIAAPVKYEVGVRWADWEIFRWNAYCDMLKLCHDAIRSEDPNHLILNSMDFPMAAWWDVPKHVDIIWRHGIGYSAAYNFMLLKNIAAWSGKVTGALCMPPGFLLPFEHYMILMDSGHTGFSCVSPAAPTYYAHYMGSADCLNGYRRREPQYTQSKAIIQLSRYMGNTYLASKTINPKVGLFLGAKTATILGGTAATDTGLLNLMTDLNLDYEVISEHNYAPLSRFDVLILGPAVTMADNAVTDGVKAYLKSGGSAIVMPGAFTKNEKNEDQSSGRVECMSRFGKEIKTALLDEAQQQMTDKFAPVMVEKEDTVLAWDKERKNAGIVVSGDGRLMLIGYDLGAVYGKNWTTAYNNWTEDSKRAEAIADNAFAEQAGRFQDGATNNANADKQKMALWVNEFMKKHHVNPSVSVKGLEIPGMVHAGRFENDRTLWVGIANRMMKAGLKMPTSYEWDEQKGRPGYQPEEYLISVTNPVVRVRLPDWGKKGDIRCFVMPKMEKRDKGLTAVPEEIEVKVQQEGDEYWAETKPGRLDDWLALVLAGNYRPLLGMELPSATVRAGGDLKVRVHVLNGTAKTIKGLLRLVDVDGLLPGMSNLTAEISLSKGEKIVRNFAVHIPFQTNPDIYHLKAVADFGDYQEASMDMEAEVLPAYDVQLEAKADMLYLKADSVTPLRLNLKSFCETSDIRFRISVSNLNEGMITPRVADVVVKKRSEGSAEFSVTMPGGTTQGVMTVRAEWDNGEAKTHEIPFRLTSGPVCYRDLENGVEAHGKDMNTPQNMVCLENENMIVRFLPNGILRDFVLRKTGQNLMATPAYPLGLTWYTWKRGWSFVRSEQDGESVSAVFRSFNNEKEKPVTMTARLSGQWLDIVIDAAEYQTHSDSFFLISAPVDADVWPPAIMMYIPLKEKMMIVKYGEKKRLTLNPDAFSSPWIAVRDQAAKTVLVNCFSIPSLKEVVIPGSETFGRSYQVFNLADNVPAGRIHFRLLGKAGVESMEAVIKECDAACRNLSGEK